MKIDQGYGATAGGPVRSRAAAADAQHGGRTSMEQKTTGDKPTTLSYVSALTRIAFTTVCYWLVGLTPEENHGTKGTAWASIHAYRWAAWHFRKYLKHSDDSWARAGLAWCYAELGMIESAVEHYRLAYARNKNPEIAIYLAEQRRTSGTSTPRSVYTMRPLRAAPISEAKRFPNLLH